MWDRITLDNLYVLAVIVDRSGIARRNCGIPPGTKPVPAVCLLHLFIQNDKNEINVLYLSSASDYSKVHACYKTEHINRVKNPNWQEAGQLGGGGGRVHVSLCLIYL